MRNGICGAVALLAMFSQPALAQSPITPTKAVILPPNSQTEAGPAPKTPVALGQPAATAPSQPIIIETYSVAPYRIWASAEYLMWWTSAQELPTPVLSSGPLGAPGTEVILGGDDPLGSPMRHGGRFTLGIFLDTEQRVALEGSYFFLGKLAGQRVAGSDGTPTSALNGLPFSDVSTFGQGTENILVLANPGAFSDVTTLSVSTFLQGYEINGALNVRDSGNARVTFLAGYRYFDLQEQLNLMSASPPIPSFPGGVTYNIYDEFGTRNQFYGGQIGLRAEVDRGIFFASATGKVALGSMHQTIVNSGQFEQYGGPFPYQVFPGGIYTQPSNIGHFTRNHLAWIPEINVNVGCRLTNAISVFAGYNFLWFSNVIRPGDQIDHEVNASQLFGGQLVGPARPGVLFNDSTFWAQGINFGVNFTW